MYFEILLLSVYWIYLLWKKWGDLIHNRKHSHTQTQCGGNWTSNHLYSRLATVQIQSDHRNSIIFPYNFLTLVMFTYREYIVQIKYNWTAISFICNYENTLTFLINLDILSPCSKGTTQLFPGLQSITFVVFAWPAARLKAFLKASGFFLQSLPRASIKTCTPSYMSAVWA